MPLNSIIEITLIVVITGGFVTLGLVWIADFRRWMKIQSAVAEAREAKPWGDVVDVAATLAKLGGEGAAGRGQRPGGGIARRHREASRP